MTRYRQLAPSPALAGHIAHYWILEGDVEPQTFFPDGSMEFIFHYGDPFQRAGTPQPKSLLVGQFRTPTTVAPTGRAGIFGIKFHPGGAYPFLRQPQQELAESIFDFADLPRGRRLAEQLGNARTDADRAALVETALPPPAPHPSDPIVAALVRSRGALAVDGLARHAGVSPRTLQRIFAERVGLSPKTLARILRFQRALTAGPRRGWAAIAAECGYFDQAHLIRDFREFTGAPPSQLARK